MPNNNIIHEEHLVNIKDHLSNIPEYEPYSL